MAASRLEHAIRRATLAATVALLTGGATPAAAPAEEALDRPVRATWTGLPLAAWAERAGGLAGRPVVLDRRIDPDRPVTLAADGVPLGVVLEQVAAAADAAVEPLASSIRLVPRAARGRLVAAERRRDDELAALPANSRRRGLARAPWQWPAGSRPRDLVETAARDGGVGLADLEAVPHDHLPAMTLPSLALAERLDFVLAHYDLRVAWGPEPRIVPLEPAPAGLLAGAAPPPKARAGRVRRGAGPAVEVFSLRLEAPLDQAVAAVAQRLGLTLELDRASLAARGILPGEIVRATVTDVSREELLDAIVGPPGLRWTITDGRLRVFAP
jgi:hypothetical protein